MQDTENCCRHNTGQERNNDREHQVPPVIAGVQVGDGHAGVDPGVVTRDGGVLPTKLTDPEVALDSRRIPTTLHIDKESSSGHGRCGEVVLLGGDHRQVTRQGGVLDNNLVAIIDISGTTLTTRGPATVTCT